MMNNVHPQFKLNSIGFTWEELKEVAYSLVKEGSTFEISLGDFLLDWLSDSSSLSVQTSGSTGNPSVIRLQKGNMVNSAIATGKFFNLEAGNKALLCLPMEYIAGKMMLVRAMVLGLDIYYKTPTATPLENNGREYEFCAMTPLQLGNSLPGLEKIKKLVVGGAAVPEDIKDLLVKKSTAVYESFGMTETNTHIALRKLGNYPEDKYFRTLENVTVTTDDRNCLKINAPELAPGIIQTNDLVECISETEFKWLGRLDNIINSGGVKLVPEQIEKKLKPYISQRIFTIGLPDDNLGEKLVLVVEGDADILAIDNKISSLKCLDKFEVPRAVVSVPKFLETKSGKILRSETAALAKL